MVRLRRKASSTAADSGVATTVSVRLPPSIKATIDGTHLYAALASTTASSSGSAATASGCKPGAPATAVVPEGSGGADAQYVRSTGTVVAVVCEAGLYHVQVMQPSLANRALPPPGSESPTPTDPAVAGLAGWAIALIAVGSLLVVGLLAVVLVTYFRSGSAASVAPDDPADEDGPMHGVAPGLGASAAPAAASQEDPRDARRRQREARREAGQAAAPSSNDDAAKPASSSGRWL
ncbi:hypothetical protein FNF28_02295 [Cafeteria roenbergensis]|nr:hypothetical protein FNF28_02295 [Cafeteria roenbergensis]